MPFVIFYIVGFAVLMKTPVFQEFTKGAKDGFQVVFDIMPTLVGLMVAIGIMRASGVLDLLAGVIKPLTNLIHFPSELIPLVTVRLFSASAATSLGRLTSVMMSCTETVFYTMSVYFMAAGVKKTRYTLAGALVSTFAGIAVSVILTNLIF